MPPFVDSSSSHEKVNTSVNIINQTDLPGKYTLADLADYTKDDEIRGLKYGYVQWKRAKKLFQCLAGGVEHHSSCSVVPKF